MQLSGVLTALVTPFEKGALDLARFQALVERQIAAGIAGLVPCGTTGETPTLDDEEWTALVRATVALARKNVPVVAGCGSNSTAKTVAQIDAAKRLGVDAALVVLPYYNKPNAAGHRAHVDACVAHGPADRAVPRARSHGSAPAGRAARRAVRAPRRRRRERGDWRRRVRAADCASSRRRHSSPGTTSPSRRSCAWVPRA